MLIVFSYTRWIGLIISNSVVSNQFPLSVLLVRFFFFWITWYSKFCKIQKLLLNWDFGLVKNKLWKVLKISYKEYFLYLFTHKSSNNRDIGRKVNCIVRNVSHASAHSILSTYRKRPYQMLPLRHQKWAVWWDRPPPFTLWKARSISSRPTWCTKTVWSCCRQQILLLVAVASVLTRCLMSQVFTI